VRADKQQIAGDGARRSAGARLGGDADIKEWRVESVQVAVCSW
jgi:hypothetical protein